MIACRTRYVQVLIEDIQFSKLMWSVPNTSDDPGDSGFCLMVRKLILLINHTLK